MEVNDQLSQNVATAGDIRIHERRAVFKLTNVSTLLQKELMKSHTIYQGNRTSIANTQPDIIRQPITTQPSVNTVCVSHPWVYSMSGSVPVDAINLQEPVSSSPGFKPRPLSKSGDTASVCPSTGSRYWSKDLFDSFKELHRSTRKWSALINLCGECCRVPCMMVNVASSLGDKRYLLFIPGTGAAIRFKVRILRGIQGTIMDDCLVTSCCCPCATCQMYREMEDFGFSTEW
ncbi:unnamed protein product [Candidula unifasciata]|uniref:Uncharacterized protein n=1 Tax=Candidula unifasciata TaxID=100452 RepID=A0A8S4A0F3_9EUPU|nr:unnamed protein product [Candidula unifasciata]